MVLLLFAVHRLEGAELVRAVALVGVMLIVRRASASAWMSRNLGGTGLHPARRQARRAALVTALALLAGAGVISLGRGDALVLAAGVAALAMATVPGVLAALEYQAARACARRAPLVGTGAAAAGALLVSGFALLLALPAFAVLAPVIALALGDAAGLFVAWHRPHPGPCHALERQPSSTPLEARPRPVAGGVATVALVGVMQLLVLTGGLHWPSGTANLDLLASLAVLGLLPLIAAGTVPALVIPGLTAGRREAVVPGLLLGATLAGASILVVTAVPNRLVGLGDPRLAPLAPYFAVAMAMLGLSQLLIHHRVASGGTRTVLILTLLATGLHLALASTGTGPLAEVAVDAALGASAVLLVSLVVATAAAAPFAFTLPAEGSDVRLRLVGPTLIALTAAAVFVRLVSLRPVWLSEAATARLTEGSFSSMFSGGLNGDAHPPLYLALAWVSRRAFGDSALALRLPSLVAGTLLVPLLYVMGKQLYDRRTGLLAAMVAAFAPPLVWFSTQAGATAVAAVLAVASLLAAHRALRRGRLSDWALLGLSEGALMWAHQLAVVHLVVLNVVVAVVFLRRPRSSHGRLPAQAGWAAAMGVLVVIAAPLLVARSGLGPPRMLPPLEFATRAAPGAGTSVFPVLGTAMSALLGFHPADVNSRLLAMWPLGILAALLVLGRARSPRGAALLTLAGAPFAAMFAAQVLGFPRSPAFALGWAATALPMLALLAGRAVSVLGGPWPRARMLGVGVAALLLVCLADQAVRVRPRERFAVGPVIERVGHEAGAGDLVAYEPAALRDLVRYEAGAADARSVAAVDEERAALTRHERVYVVAAFALGSGDAGVKRTVTLVKELSATRPLVQERGATDGQTKVWVFGPERNTASGTDR
ncbi:MAG TPA: glycosyltransferase family 39 protein [Acidimicrobiales bacterium]|nr:glycosyltransferase family 39 protein [Acidimicrobiales bacterium]